MPWRPWEDVLALVELAAPSECAGCGRPGLLWCGPCDRELRGAAPRRWTPTPSPPGLPPTWAGPAYEGVVRQAVVAWKDADRADLTAVLAPVLRRALTAALAGAPEHRAELAAGRPVPVLPAPSARASTRRRGEHRVRALAEAALGLPRSRVPVLDGLVLARTVADQAGLRAAERARNLRGAVRVRDGVRERLRGRPCVLVDDVITTGATLQECARALREAGSGTVVAVALAATRRHAADRPGDSRRSPFQFLGRAD
ncbi:MAG: ComF family protein [Acidobacteria bacterium]|nr:MAG: ComF family protein [Acidobacteriota bacterium]